MLNVPNEQLILALYAWISAAVYAYTVYKIIQWRKIHKRFQSSYYLLFLMQAAADLHTFIAIEFILRPRRYNYFKLFNVYMQGFAEFSYFCMGNARALLCCGHLIIAINRFTSIYYPFSQERVWTHRKTIMYMSILWILVVSTSLPYLLLPNAVYFASRPGGVIMLSAGALAEYAASQNVVINLITIITCTICYVACYLRIRDPQDGYRVVDRSLFFCALFSSLPFCAEVVRCLLALATFEVKNELYEISIELWYYLAEVLATSSVWIQLLTNRSVRSILLDRSRPHQQSYGTAALAVT